MKLIKIFLKKNLAKDIKVFLKTKKKKKRHYGCEQYRNLQEDEKQKLVEYRKIKLYNEKNCVIIIIRNYYFKI